MEILLDRIVEELNSRNIKTRFDEEDCIYFVSNIIPDVELKLYSTDDAIVAENNFGETGHVLSFRDFVNAVHFWVIAKKRVSIWNDVTPDWKLVFDEFLDNYDLVSMRRIEEDLPF